VGYQGQQKFESLLSVGKLLEIEAQRKPALGLWRLVTLSGSDLPPDQWKTVTSRGTPTNR
ncbi:MAG TPA: hypothetical protein VIG25_02985, partial [Pyrinomonadaceae bacterium]